MAKEKDHTCTRHGWGRLGHTCTRHGWGRLGHVPTRVSTHIHVCVEAQCDQVAGCYKEARPLNGHTRRMRVVRRRSLVTHTFEECVTRFTVLLLTTATRVWSGGVH